MKKILVLLSLVILLSSLAHAGLNALSEAKTPQLSIILQSQSPDPVEPGQIVTIKFKVENSAKETTEDVIIELLPKFPFKLYGDVAKKNIGKLQAVTTGADATIVEYRLKVDDDAAEGETEIELKVLLFGNDGIIYKDDDFMIDIQTHDAILDITSITSNPEQIAPGETAEVSIMVKNLADSLLKDIKFKLDLGGDTLPLAPYQSSSERRISQLKSNFQNSMNFKIIADPDATPGLYKVPLSITYNDEKGNAYSVSDVLAVVIGETPKIKAYIKKSSVMQKNKEGKITLEIANTGTSDLKFLELFLLPSEDYQLITTSNYFYLGDVDSDDTESEEINVFINRGIKTLTLPIKLKYLDANNKPFQQQFDLELPLYSTSKLKQFGLIENGNTSKYLFILILIIAGYFYYLKRKKPEEYSKKIKALKVLKEKIPFMGSKNTKK